MSSKKSFIKPLLFFGRRHPHPASPAEEANHQERPASPSGKAHLASPSGKAHLASPSGKVRWMTRHIILFEFKIILFEIKNNFMK